MVQNLTIDSEISNSSMFVGGDFESSDFNELIDGTTADSDDGDYIYNYGDDDGLVVGLTEGDDPEVHTGHKVYSDIKASPGAGSTAIKIKLLQGASTIIKDFFIPGPSSEGAFNVTTLSEAEAEDITDYTDLRFEIGSIDGGFGAGSGALYCAYLEIPDAPAAASGAAFMLFVE